MDRQSLEIDSDEELALASLAGVGGYEISGSGTASDPYVIQCIRIADDGVVRVANTTAVLELHGFETPRLVVAAAQDLTITDWDIRGLQGECLSLTQSVVFLSDVRITDCQSRMSGGSVRLSDVHVRMTVAPRPDEGWVWETTVFSVTGGTLAVENLSMEVESAGWMGLNFAGSSGVAVTITASRFDGADYSLGGIARTLIVDNTTFEAGKSAASTGIRLASPAQAGDVLLSIRNVSVTANRPVELSRNRAVDELDGTLRIYDSTLIGNSCTASDSVRVIMKRSICTAGLTALSFRESTSHVVIEQNAFYQMDVGGTYRLVHHDGEAALEIGRNFYGFDPEGTYPANVRLAAPLESPPVGTPPARSTPAAEGMFLVGLLFIFLTMAQLRHFRQT